MNVLELQNLRKTLVFEVYVGCSGGRNIHMRAIVEECEYIRRL
jgi:hypothetical protein